MSVRVGGSVIGVVTALAVGFLAFAFVAFALEGDDDVVGFFLFLAPGDCAGRLRFLAPAGGDDAVGASVVIVVVVAATGIGFGAGGLLSGVVMVLDACTGEDCGDVVVERSVKARGHPLLIWVNSGGGLLVLVVAL